METAIPPREETGSQVSARLLEVIAHADFEVLTGLYAFEPLTEGVTPWKDALACVRDGGATRLMVQPALAAVDQTGLAERIRSRLATRRPS